MLRHASPALRLLGGVLFIAILAAAALLGPSVTSAKSTATTTTTKLPTCSPATPIATATAVSATAVPTMQPTPEVATPTANGCTVTIDLADIKFVPNDVTIPADTPVRFILHNVGALNHNFSITDHNNPKVKNLKISVNVDSGKTMELTINAPAGDYYFFCNVPGHEQAGMHGTLHVVKK